MRRRFWTAAAAGGAVLSFYVISLLVTGQPAFGLLSGSPLQSALVPKALVERLPGEANASAPQQGNRAARLAVSVATVEARRVPVSRSYSGRLVAARQAELRARVRGFVAEQSVADASFVEAGTPLFRLDQRPFSLAIEQTQAALEGAMARYRYLDRELERITRLESEEFATTSRLDELTGQRNEASARVAELEAQLKRNRLDLDYATISAPFAGKIGFSRVDIGDLVTPDRTILTTIVQYDPIEVAFRPSAKELAEIKTFLRNGGQRIGVTVALDGDERSYEGRLVALGAAFDPGTNTIELRARLANPDGAMTPGQFAEVTAAFGNEEALLVPSTALVVNQDRRAVYRVDPESKAEIVPVTAGMSVGEKTVVRGPLSAGDRIVTGKLGSVRPGSPLAVTSGSDDAEAVQE